LEARGSNGGDPNSNQYFSPRQDGSTNRSQPLTAREELALKIEEQYRLVEHPAAADITLNHHDILAERLARLPWWKKALRWAGFGACVGRLISYEDVGLSEEEIEEVRMMIPCKCSL